MAKTRNPCCRCGQIIPPELIEQKRLQRLARLKATQDAMRAKGIPVGRQASPRTKVIAEAREKGFSYKAIESMFGATHMEIRSAIQLTQRKKKAPSLAPVKRPSMELDFEILPCNNAVPLLVVNDRQE